MVIHGRVTLSGSVTWLSFPRSLTPRLARTPLPSTHHKASVFLDNRPHLPCVTHHAKDYNWILYTHTWLFLPGLCYTMFVILVLTLCQVLRFPVWIMLLIAVCSSPDHRLSLTLNVVMDLSAWFCVKQKRCITPASSVCLSHCVSPLCVTVGMLGKTIKGNNKTDQRNYKILGDVLLSESMIA